MSIDNLITLIVGLLLFISGFLVRRKKQAIDWLYVILGLIIFIIGILRVFKIVRI